MNKLSSNNMTDAIETIEYRGKTIEIFQDVDTENPRKEWDNLGVIACKHSRYELGDKEHDIDFDETDESLDKQMARFPVTLPLYLYDHSGITMNTTGFSCEWDSGQVGFIYATSEAIKENFNVKRISKKLLAEVTKILVGEIETYDKYLTGEVFGYDTGDDSCWGYFDREQLLDDAKGSIDFDLEQERKAKIKKTKAKIKNNVPLINR